MRSPKRGLAPILPASLRVLILGSFPSEASLAADAYYAHPRNHFWRVLAGCGVIPDAAAPYRDRRRALTVRGIGLWDLYRRVEQSGSSDSSIREAKPSDISTLWAERGPFTILLNGKRRREWQRHFRDIPAEPVELPSTSPRPLHWNTPRGAAEARAAWCAALRTCGVAGCG